jgi:hypothetical protein
MNMNNTTVIDEHPMVKQQTLETNESRPVTNATDATEFVDSTQSDPHDPHLQIENQHTMIEKPIRSRYGLEIKPTLKYKDYKQQRTVKSLKIFWIL